MPVIDPTTWVDPSPGEMKPYTPSWREQLTAAIQDSLSGLGASRGYAQNVAEGAGKLITSSP